MPHPTRRSAAPWLFGLAVALVLISPLLFVGVWTMEGTLEGFVPALLATLTDLVAALAAAVVALVLAAQRGITRVRTVISGHPDGRAGRMAEYHRARWSIARERFAGLQREYAAYEADPGAVAARPALADVTVPATARFVQAYADAEYLCTDAEPTGPRREEFAAAVDRAVGAWHDAQRVAEGLAAARAERGGHEGGAAAQDAVSGGAAGASGAEHHTGQPGQEYAEIADAVRRAAARGMADLRARMRA
jgi:hypothetical protein